MSDKIKNAVEKFEKLVEHQLERVAKINKQGDFIDYKSLPKIIVGIVHGDGIGPVITREAGKILAYILYEEIDRGKVEIRQIDGLTVENRTRAMKPIPDDVLEEIKGCHVLLKGPTTTPNAADGTPNLESANVAIRKELDLFANVRPIKVPEKGIDWTFFRENTEGGYAVGSKGVQVDDDLAVDFTITTTEGSERVIRAAFEFAKNNGKNRVTAVTKANIIKATDGKFLNIFKEIAEKYPEIEADDWYIDIMAAKLLDRNRCGDFQVFVMPNLYGDILTDEAAEIQGGVGTAGSANIGKEYAMFEAVHGSAPRMVDSGRAEYANPSSIIKAAAMLLSHIGYTEYSEKLEKALEAAKAESITCSDFGDNIMKELDKELSKN